MKIRPIHPFGPPVGKWKSHGTVAETIARIKAEQKKREQQEASNVTTLRKAK
jgi:hypothetical protein